jgi:hypothetical protein
MLLARLVPALFALLAANALAFDYQAYKPAQLAAVAPSVQPPPEAKLHMYFDASHPRYTTLVRFTGKTRMIGEVRQTFIEDWVKSMRHPSQYARLFNREIEIVQDGRAWWLPIQSELVDPLEREVTPDGEVDLYVLLMGAVNGDVVFSVSEFEARPNPSLKRSANGVALGPRGALVHHAPHGPSATPPAPA